MFFVVKKRTLWKTLIAIVLTACIAGACTAIALTSSPGINRVIVLDAGHGGMDGGVTGVKSGVTESEINLTVTLLLKNALEDKGFKVVLTRSGSGCADGVDDAKGFNKKEDMAARKRCIERAEPTLVISIHCNKFPTSMRRGAQVFYNEFSSDGKALALCLQASLNKLNSVNTGRTFTALGGDYYLLNCSGYPSAIVECGFLSNAEDEALLLDRRYREELAANIAEGVEEWLRR